MGAAAAVVALAVASPAGAVELAAGVDAGYAFRSSADHRNHGAVAAVRVDVPLPLWPRSPLGLRPELFALGLGGSDEAPRNLGLFAGALSLVYAFDDTEVEALAAVGPMAGLVVDGDAAEAQVGALASIGLGLPVGDAGRLEARVMLPAPLWGPRGTALPAQDTYADGSAVALPLQACFMIGFVVDLEAALHLAGEGVGPEGMLPSP